MYTKAKIASGFTLVEMLVTVAVISLLLALVLPALNGANQTARMLKNINNQRMLSLGQASVAAENRDEYATINTGKNAEYQAMIGAESSIADGLLKSAEQMEGNTFSTNPTSLTDWISPALGRSMELSPNRAERTWQIFSMLADPAATKMNDLLWPFSDASADREDFDKILAERGYPQISYLAPVTFHYGGFDGSSGRRLANGAGGIPIGKDAEGQTTYGINGYDEPFNVHESFSPRMDKLGAPSAKVVVADGSRYWDHQTKLLDFDTDPNPSFYGSYLSSTPVYGDSTAYKDELAIGSYSPGANPLVVVRYDNWRLSVRHMGGTVMCAAFFDGHVQALPKDDAYGKVDMWAPARSVIDMNFTPDLDWQAQKYIYEKLGSRTSSTNPYHIR